MAIQPISLASAAGIENGNGDVRHLSQGDSLDVVGISTPTRHLAARDNLLANKLNEIVSVVNNQEQYVPLPVMRTLVTPSEEIVVTNYRIPVGFEARVLNAAISTLPASTDAELIIYYSSSYGAVTGTSIVNTSSEFTGGVNFSQSGEFIVALKNKSAQTLEITASVILTMRPLGAEGTLLVGSVIEGPVGPPGPPGVPGPQGPAGTGGAGTPGIVFRGSYDGALTDYVANDVVRYDLYGTLPSSFIALRDIGNASANCPVDGASTYWDFLARGSSGPAGSDAGLTLNSSNSITGGTFIPASGDYTGGAYTFGGTVYDGNAAGQVIVPVYQNYVEMVNSTGTYGIVGITCQRNVCFTGSAVLRLPSKLDTAYAKATYSTKYIGITAVMNGTQNVFGGTVPTVVSMPVPNSGDRDFGIEVIADRPLPVQITLHGVQTYFVAA